MSTRAERITTELRVLIGHPLVGCWRAADMHIFEFGPRKLLVNRKGEQVEVGTFRLHVQCRWRLVDGVRIVFGRDDLNYPAAESISMAEFDWDKHDSALDVARRRWLDEPRDPVPTVGEVRGDSYGGFRIRLEGGFALGTFPCDSRRDESSEHWRLLGHRDNGSHFVVRGDGNDGHE